MGGNDESSCGIRGLFRKILHSPLFWVLMICLGVQIIYFSQMLPYEVCGDTSSYTYEYDPGFRTPFYPMFANMIRIFTGSEEGVWLTTMAIVQKVIMFASIFLFWALICKITNNKYARFFATLIYGATPAIFSWAACILTEAFSIVEIIALMYFTVKYLREHKKVDAFLSGIMILVLIMTRPAAVYLLIVYAVFWGLQLFVAIRGKVSRKRFFAVRAGIVGFVVAVCGVFGYCLYQKVAYDRFSLSSVSYVNDLLNVIDTGIYQRSSNEEIRDYISQSEKETSDIYRIIWQGLMKKYSRDELEQFSGEIIHENRLQYIKDLFMKTIEWSIKPIGTAYNSFREGYDFNLKQIAGLFFPVSFGLIFVFIMVGCVWFVVRVISKKRLDWGLLISVMLVGGNVAVTIIAAPYEPERLCVTSLPVLIVGATYAFEISAKNGGGRRLESSISDKQKL